MWHGPEGNYCLGKLPKKFRFFGRPFPNLSNHPPTPGFLWDSGKQKVKFGSKRAIFGAIWGGFEGFGPCLGISHPTHPHLGKISQKKRFYFLAASLNQQMDGFCCSSGCIIHWNPLQDGIAATLQRAMHKPWIQSTIWKHLLDFYGGRLQEKVD